jgi:hypothetical protein
MSSQLGMMLKTVFPMTILLMPYFQNFGLQKYKFFLSPKNFVVKKSEGQVYQLLCYEKRFFKPFAYFSY